MSDIKLVKSWMQLQQLPEDSNEITNLMWASDEVLKLALRKPQQCWEFILKVLQLTEDEWILTNLAAGPLENLLSLNPDVAFEWIENEFPNNKKLQSLLNGVWQNLIPDEVWHKLKNLA